MNAPEAPRNRKRDSRSVYGRKVIDGSDDWYREPIRHPRDITQTHSEKLLIPYITETLVLRCAVTLIPSGILGYVSGISLAALNGHSRRDSLG